MSKKHIIILIIVLALLTVVLCFARLQDRGQKISFEAGGIVLVPQETEAPSPQPVPDSTPSKSGDGDIEYEPDYTDDPDILAKQARIRALIQEVYSLRDYYVSKLNSMEASAKAEYTALPEEEHTQENKESIATRYINSAYSLESECDGKIDSICGELGDLLLETGGDFSIINKVRYTYASEKAAMKDEIKQTYYEFF